MAMTHSDKDIAKYFNDHEIFMTNLVISSIEDLLNA